MIKKMNTVFFSVCFLAAIIAETYCIQILKGDWFSVIGIGVVVLITGYLLFDSIRTQFVKGSDKIQYILDHMYREESEKWSERYTELINLQKASYSVAKKNHTFIKDQYELMLQRIENLEESNLKALLKIAELQKKSLEGQKNALNLQINYNKENTKQLIKALQEGNHQDQSELLNRIATLLEENNGLLKELQVLPMASTANDHRTFTHDNQPELEEELPYEYEPKVKGFIQEDEFQDHSQGIVPEPQVTLAEDNFDLTWDMDEELQRLSDLGNQVTEDTENVEDIEHVEDTENIDDTEDIEVTDDIKDTADIEVTGEKESFDTKDIENKEFTELVLDNQNLEEYPEKEISYENDYMTATETDVLQEFDLSSVLDGILSADNSVIDEEKIIEEDKLTQEDNLLQEADLNSLMMFDPEYITEPEPEPIKEVEHEMESAQEPEQKTITPLYDDPNKALTADEIAALFASFGQ